MVLRSTTGDFSNATEFYVDFGEDSFIDDTVSANTTYYYRVVREFLQDSSRSPSSNEIVVTTPAS